MPESLQKYQAPKFCNSTDVESLMRDVFQSQCHVILIEALINTTDSYHTFISIHIL